MAVWNPEKFFASLPFFRNVPVSELQKFVWQSRRMPFKKGDYLFQEGEPAEAAWWVTEGFVKIAKSTPQGRLITMEMLMPGEIFGPAGVIRMSHYPASAVAVTKGAAARLPGEALAALARACPSVAQGVLTEVSQRIQRAHRLRALDAESADKKVAAALLWLREKTGSPLAVPRREIAEIAGVAPETAIRVVLQFKEKGWLTAKPGAIALVRPEHLRKLVDEGP
ncbi:MAG TPA: Crp/Fnr family transcriptional regulator [Elusimicrobiota bacterium]|nr:Crp/Fnr family transcriptional regulator [Elusimicrobiota bacterium]